MDTKDEDTSDESKKNHMVYYKSLTSTIENIKEEKMQEQEQVIQNHLDKRIQAMEEDKKRIRTMFPDITQEEWDGN
ncbi:MAG: hypothetical protein HOK63_03495 [Thaumarchaeota archaeon]|jgi:uncharacterized protein YicC (UPF0701 family)|nr:hypothetical protein [Nitrososphaerota archaeon]MBT6468701.1 hypothetical protein [Nitrososphaerota archaeon]